MNRRHDRGRRDERHVGRWHRCRHRARSRQAQHSPSSRCWPTRAFPYPACAAPRSPRRDECAVAPRPPSWPGSTGGWASPTRRPSAATAQATQASSSISSAATARRSITRRAGSLRGPKIRVHLAGGRSAAIAAALAFRWSRTSVPPTWLAGGQGAPLVPLLDYVLFADPKARPRPAEHRRHRQSDRHSGWQQLPQAVIAFDTGPGNMVIDSLAQKLFEKPYDRNGAIAAKGQVLDAGAD